MAWNKIGKSDELKQGEIKEYNINGKKIIVSNMDDKFYAIDAICSHLGAELAKGKKDNNTIICPKHHAIFNIQTGKVEKNINGLFKFMTRKDASDLKSYEVKAENNEIMINL